MIQKTLSTRCETSQYDKKSKENLKLLDKLPTKLSIGNSLNKLWSRFRSPPLWRLAYLMLGAERKILETSARGCCASLQIAVESFECNWNRITGTPINTIILPPRIFYGLLSIIQCCDREEISFCFSAQQMQLDLFFILVEWVIICPFNRNLIDLQLFFTSQQYGLLCLAGKLKAVDILKAAETGAVTEIIYWACADYIISFPLTQQEVYMIY